MAETPFQRSIAGLVERHGSPLLVMSRTQLARQMARFREALPKVEPFYAVKANPHPAVLKMLARAGAGFDVASATELEAALAAGAAPDRLIFANTVKPPQALRLAHRRGVRLMTFDSASELRKIAALAPRARVVVRIRVPNTGSLVNLSKKFGTRPQDAVPLLLEARRLGLEPAGLSFHVGSQCRRPRTFAEALRLAARIADEAAARGMPLSILDIGGGFPIRQIPDDKDHFDDIAATVRKELARRVSDLTRRAVGQRPTALEENGAIRPGLRIIAEPGRFMVGPAGTLVMNVIGTAVRDGVPWYYMDDGVFGTLSTIVFDHMKFDFRTLRRGRRVKSVLAGPTCDSLDILSRNTLLPPLELGDIVYVENLGAYSNSCATTFNGLGAAKVVMVP
jgi:ornithine decarboxylase